MSSSISKAPPPALNVLGPIPSLQMDDEEMRDQQESPGPMKSPKGGKNTLGLTLPGGNAACTHSVDSMLCPGSPPRRIILEADRSSQQLLGGGDQQQQRNISSLLKTPPLICEQGPSAPSSPTTPSPGARSAKRPCPLSVDALQRLNLLSPNYMPSAHMDSSTKGGGLPPVSPGYPTSDLGSSPRSSISASHYSSLGINAANWNSFRDAYTRRHGAGSGDDDASECGMDKAGTHAMLLSPCHQMLSPAPFSPFSDCGVADLHVASASATPYSSRSPNLSPSPMRRSAGNNLHFSFDQIRSRSSLSNHGSGTQEAAQRQAIMHQKSLDSDARERSRSEGEALAADNQGNRDDHLDEHMDTSHGQGHSTLSVPAGAGGSHLHAGQKRRLQRSRRAGGVEEDGGGSAKTTTSSRQQQTGTTKAAEGISQQDSLTGPGPSASQQPSRQPTIEEPPPSPTLTELFQPGDLDKDRRRQVEDWIRQQTAALEAFRHSLIPPQQEANLLQVPTIVPQNSLEQLWPSPSADQSQAGPIRSPTLWRRSRSESDVSAATAAAVAEGNRTAGSAAGSRRQSQQAPQLMIPLNEATHVCEHCGQGFSMHDRLAKHIASRHRDRSSSMNDEGNRVHKCQLCPKSFGRSDMLTRHMRLHTGLKPYACQLCGQVFSRSDHLSTHQRTHTGEKPYRCPQCNYAASRRDMITRHMRTHLMADGSPTPFAEFQIPPINELSLNPSCASQSAVVSPQPSRPESPMLTNSSSSVGGHQPVQQTGGQHQQEACSLSTQKQQQPTQQHFQPPQQQQQQQMDLMKFLSAAVANGAVLNPQLMLNSLGAQLPPHLRRSSPNLLSPGDYPSAFRPPFGGQPSGTAAAVSALEPAIAAAAAAQVLFSQQQQQQHQQPNVPMPMQRLSLPSGQSALPFLLRQNSFGGLGFSEQQLQNSQSEDRNK